MDDRIRLSVWFAFMASDLKGNPWNHYVYVEFQHGAKLPLGSTLWYCGEKYRVTGIGIEGGQLVFHLKLIPEAWAY